MGLLGGASTFGLAGASAFGNTSQETPAKPSGFRAELKSLVDQTPLVDSHEHLADEVQRLTGSKRWTLLLEHYFSDDFVSAGMNRDSVFGNAAKNVEPLELWKRLQPYWNAVKNTGSGQAARISMRELSGIEDLNDNTVPLLQDAVEKLITKGFYRRLLQEHAGIESCQVDRGPYSETRQPTLLLQDINIYSMQAADVQRLSRRSGTTVKDLSDWHELIRQVFKKYGPYTTAIKTAIAYGRGIDFEKVTPEAAEEPFKKRLENQPLTGEEQKRLEDHLFWFCVEQADEYELPVKLHTGYYVGNNSMPIERLSKNPDQAATLCRLSPNTRWMFMHTCYPFGRELIAVAKQYTSAHLQTCWAWIIDPIGTKNFLKQYIVTAPANKIHVFGGDYQYVESVVGHARIARNGVCAALYELVQEGYLSEKDALELVEPLLRGNARRIFQLEKKYEMAKTVPWRTEE
jgi:predicted TIM-barrel fold metal-dependent hydrolase